MGLTPLIPCAIVFGMMKLLSALALPAVLTVGLMPLYGQTSAPSAPQVAAESPVAQAIAAANVVNAKPNLNADYYIYVQSASWCGPCKKEMPELVKIYPQMQAANVELILVDMDDSAQSALAFLQSFHAAFPGIHYQDPAMKNLPGYAEARAVPHATIVDAKGRLVAKGHGLLALQWQRIIEDDKEDM